MDWYKMVRQRTVTPRFTGFDWTAGSRSKNGIPKKPWDLITFEDSDEIRSDALNEQESLFFGSADVSNLTRQVKQLTLDGEKDEPLLVRPLEWCQKFEEMDCLLQNYGQGVNARVPFNNPLGAPVSALKVSLVLTDEEKSRSGLLILVYSPGDNKYYRAEFHTLFEDSNTLLVFLVDEGTYRTTEAKHAYRLPHRFSVAAAPFAVVEVFPRNKGDEMNEGLYGAVSANRITPSTVSAVMLIAKRCFRRYLTQGQPLEICSLNGAMYGTGLLVPLTANIIYPAEVVKEEMEKFFSDSNFQHYQNNEEQIYRALQDALVRPSLT